MRDNDLSSPDAVLRPKSARLGPEPPQASNGQAAGTGGGQMLGPDGILELQRTAGNAAVSSMLQRDEDDPGVHDVISGSGRALEPQVRTDMEARLGHDFSDVRIHDDARAHASAQAVNAHAYTSGSNVVFQRGKYDPGSTDGRVMLAHELTHVVQQRNGPVDGTPAGGGISVSDPSDRFEREAAATAEQAAGSGAPDPLQRKGSGDGNAHIQRDAEPAEEQVQGAFIQRDAEPEDEKEEEAAT